MRRVIAAVGLGLLVALTAGAQDGPVTIKLKKAGPGVVTRETKTEKATNKITLTVMGNDQLKTEGGTSKFVYTEEVVERPAGAKKPTNLKRTYETAELNKGGQAEELGLAARRS
jgi:hypothetical protein